LLSDCVPTLAKPLQHGCPFDSDSDPSHTTMQNRPRWLT
jgi:hypothetical protein